MTTFAWCKCGKNLLKIGHMAVSLINCSIALTPTFEINVIAIWHILFSIVQLLLLIVGKEGPEWIETLTLPQN